jgi:hypothetical protein
MTVFLFINNILTLTSVVNSIHDVEDKHSLISYILEDLAQISEVLCDLTTNGVVYLKGEMDHSFKVSSSNTLVVSCS